MYTINLKPQTVLTTVGPSHSGKSTEARRIKEYMDSIGRSCVILESDAYRRDMLHLAKDAEIPKQKGFVISELVFDRIKTDLKYYTSSPCNTDIVIVDTTGLDERWRKQVAEIAREACYSNVAMLFTLSKIKLFERVSDTSKGYVDRQLKRMREQVLPAFNKNDYMTVIRIDDKKCDNITYDFNDPTKVLHLTSGKYAIYGDIHQQHKSLKELVSAAEEKGFTDHILIGDYLDKDDKQSMLETLQYVFDMCKAGRMKLIRANHEDYVYRNLHKDGYVYELNDETRHFNSLEHLLQARQDGNEAALQFTELFNDYTYDYAHIDTDKAFGYITHSPCLPEYLGKHSPKALKLARNTRFFSDDKNAVELMGPILENAQSNRPLHIFGHVEVGNKFHTYKNLIALDTGCVSGGHLTAMLYDIDRNESTFINVKSEKPDVTIKDFGLHIKAWSDNKVYLDPVQEKRLRRIVRSNPAFISGTVSPAPSFDSELESLDAGINMFINRGITKIIAQKKHMGSRCQVYLYKDREKCYATSRNGFRINRPWIEQIIDKEFEKYKGQYDDLLITDNELMPWSYLGKGLVDTAFMPYYQAVNSDLEALKSSSPVLQAAAGFDSEKADNLERFNKQVDIYASDVPAYLETFGVVYCDGRELLTASLPETLTRFGIDYVEFDLSTEQGIKDLQSYYEETIVDGKTEGIVIKPSVWCKDMIPCMKIRNTEYLRIVYGYDYTSDVEDIARKKRITNKLRLSIVEHNLNLDLITAFVNDDKEVQREIYKSLILEFSKESSLDPRL